MRRVASLPGFIGKPGSSATALALYAAAIAISAYLFAYVPPFRYNVAYAVPIALTDAMLAYVSVGYMLRGSTAFYRAARNVSLAAMSLALIAILIAPLTAGLFG